MNIEEAKQKVAERNKYVSWSKLAHDLYRTNNTAQMEIHTDEAWQMVLNGLQFDYNSLEEQCASLRRINSALRGSLYINDVDELQKEIERLKETDRINCIMIKELKAENERHKHNLCKLREQLDAYMIKEMNGEEKATPANVETKKIRVEVLDGATKCLMSEIGIQITIPICPF